MHLHSWFVTFTYSDEHLPPGGVLQYSDFQSFLRRARKRFGKFRFFVAGEYGTQFQRPHFHACLFGLRLDDLVRPRRSPSGHTLWHSVALQDSWGLGFVSVGVLSFESAAYTAAYCCKKQSARVKVDPSTGELVPEFARMSLKPGIGAAWFDKFGSTDCLPRDFVRIEGRKIPVPRYYTQKFKARDPFGFDALSFDRETRSNLTASDRTPERLAVREVCEVARLSTKLRKL